MSKRVSKKILQSAAEKCRQTGGRLTDKRSRILGILVESESPLSAYEIVDRYNASADKSMPAMSAYRILDFLVSEQLAHKLASENKYVVCSHIVCSHEHQIPQFLICRKCRRVKEIAIPRKLVETLKKHVDGSGYQLMSSQLELDCICERCLENAA